MRKINKFCLWAFIVFGLIGLMESAMAESMLNTLNTPSILNKDKTVPKDILSDNGTENNLSSDNDMASDYDSNKESESESAASTPLEEEESSLLDEEGNISVPEQNSDALK